MLLGKESGLKRMKIVFVCPLFSNEALLQGCAHNKLFRHHPNPKHAQYVEKNIHSKRPLFANQNVKTFPALVMEHITFIQSLMNRYLSSEKNQFISLHHLQYHALALQSTDEGTIEGLKG
ncbi:hypothetical protein IV203_032701 [Nitzschia inconspicua]|uniref:Uncharacterized protein n=1 Tax=Nitzschia inconspicua TaxID=303405 RepID=A0A9K3KK49_9STRA|nr:hypothetical protein IV203_032701 [Nitzschia inconspicua]